MGFDFNNDTPIYMQIVKLIETRIFSGEYPEGSRLPSVRDLALSIKANPNTVQRALSEIEELGLIYTERTNGKFVTSDVSVISKHKEEYAKSLARKYLKSMEKIGIGKTDAVRELESTEGNE